MNNKRQVILVILTSALLSISLALYNNFPFTYPDSAGYLASGIDNNLPSDRPIFYGWFLRYTHFNDNLMFSILAQGLLASYVLYLFFKAFSRSVNKKLHFLLSVGFLCAFTGYSFFTSFLMPDIFTPLLLISMATIVYGNLTGANLWTISLICFYSTLVHSSHFPLYLGCLLLLGGGGNC